MKYLTYMKIITVIVGWFLFLTEFIPKAVHSGSIMKIWVVAVLVIFILVPGTCSLVNSAAEDMLYYDAKKRRRGIRKIGKGDT